MDHDDLTDDGGIDVTGIDVGGVDVGDSDGRATVRLWGEIDASLRDQASVAMVGLAKRGGPYVIDVAEVTFIDSAGIAFILQLHRLATEEGSTAILRDPPGLVTDLLELIGLTGTIPLEFSATDDDAVARVVTRA